MATVAEKPGADLANALWKETEAEAAHTPMDEVLEAASRGEISDDGYFHLLGDLWVLKRMMYYVYGSWAMGLNVNEYPPTVAYLLSKQIYDESTHEMQYVDEILRRKWARTQQAAFRHPYGQFSMSTQVASYIFSLRGLANFAQNVRIAGLNLGPKVLELAWLERFGQSLPDERIRALFASQVAETRSHVYMGRVIVERYVQKPVDHEIARIEWDVIKKSYWGAMEEIAGHALGRASEVPSQENVPEDVD